MTKVSINERKHMFRIIKNRPALVYQELYENLYEFVEYCLENNYAVTTALLL